MDHVPVQDIAEKYIEGTPEIGSVGVMPETTNSLVKYDENDGASVDGFSKDAPMPNKITGLSNDDASVSEGSIRYDIRFYATVPHSRGRIKLIINLEAQNKYHMSYPLIK